MALRYDRSQKTLEDRLAVRFLIKKSKRIRNITRADLLVPAEETKGKENSAEKKNRKDKPAEKTKIKEKLRAMTPERLLSLGMSYKRDKTTHERQSEPTQDDFLFAKPQVFQCDICSKTFLHRIPYRKHMIRHVKNTRRCTKCGLGFKAITQMRRHQLACRGAIPG